jgi:uncharacterized protein YegJ (DUF2314 family)
MRFEGDDFLINCFPVPYVNDVETTAADFPDLRMRKAFSQHRAWLSVDLLGERESKDLPKVYRRIGKLTAELADTDCLAIYSPATSQMMVYDATLEEGLRGDNPIELFNNPPLLPVVEVDGDEPEVAAAVAEAVERWPEFLSAFQNQRGELFNVKARVNDGKHVEYIWLSPTSIENGVIYGKLENDPVELRYKLGDRVRVQLSDLNDWVYKSGESLVGGFTIKAIQEIQSKKQR